MERSIVFAGFGGQGLLFAGQILARAAIKDGLEVFWIPSLWTRRCAAAPHPAP